jgi:hypothetical protein
VQAVSVLHTTASVIPSTSRQFFAIRHPTPLRLPA